MCAEVKRTCKEMESGVTKIKCVRSSKQTSWLQINSECDGKHSLTVKKMNKEILKCEGEYSRLKITVVLKEENRIN